MQCVFFSFPWHLFCNPCLFSSLTFQHALPPCCKYLVVYIAIRPHLLLMLLHLTLSPTTPTPLLLHVAPTTYPTYIYVLQVFMRFLSTLPINALPLPASVRPFNDEPPTSL